MLLTEQQKAVLNTLVPSPFAFQLGDYIEQLEARVQALEAKTASKKGRSKKTADAGRPVN